MLLSVLIQRSGLPEINEEDREGEEQDREFVVSERQSVFDYPHLLLGVLTLFVYTGVEVIAANSIIGYGTYLNIPLGTAKFFTSFTLIGMLVGFLVGIVLIPKYMSQRAGLKISALLGLVFGLGAIMTDGVVSVVLVALLGLANSLVGAAVWPLALRGLGRFTKIGSGLLVMAISGAAVIPLLYGWLTDQFNAQQAYWVIIPCYLMIGWYAVSGFKVGLVAKESNRR